MTMIAQMLRKKTFWAVLLGLGLLNTVLTGNYAGAILGFLKDWVPLIGVFILLHFLTPTNRLQTLHPVYKALLIAVGIGITVWGIIDLYHALKPTFSTYL
jgi:membrane associated rhomboid family serine protease